MTTREKTTKPQKTKLTLAEAIAAWAGRHQVPSMMPTPPIESPIESQSTPEEQKCAA